MAEYKPSEERRLRQQQGLVYYGEITTYTDPTHFKVSELAGFGDDFFKNYYVYVVRDAGGAGAAPQGEDAKKTTDYTSSDGTFTHLAFVANLAVGDEVVLLHESIALAGAGGGAYSGDIEIWDSFEYPSNASLQAKWPKSGGAASPTRSTTAFYQRYSMSIAISGAGVGEVHRAFSTPRDIGTLHNISITARSNKAAGDSFQFTLYDSAGNYSYWTQTIAAQDTWETFNIDPHSTPTADGGTPVDLDDVVELRLANLTNASTYLFDLIRFESLVSSKIGIGYDGLDDALETASSVRGHLLDITDDYLKYLTTAALGTHTGGSIGDYVKMLYGAAIGGSPTSHSAFERIKAIDDKIPSKPYLMGSADADGGFDTEAKADIEAQAEAALEDAGQVMVITTIDTLASQTSFTLTAGSADDDAYNGMIAVIEDASTATQKAIGVISNYVGISKTVTLREDPSIFTMAATDKISIKALSPDILNILADTNELQTDWANGGRLDLILDIIAADTIYIADGALPASPIANSLARFVASGGTALGTPLPDSESIYDSIKHIVNTAVTGAGVANSIVDKLDLGAGYKPASDQYYTTTRGPYLDILNTDSKYILSTALTAPTVNSLVKFIASGGTGLGTTLAASKSLIDAIGHTGSALLASGIGMELRRGTGTQIPDNKGIYDYLQYLTGNSYTRLGTPVGASISVDIAAIKAEIDNGTYGLSALEALVDDLETRLGTPVAGTVAGDVESIETKVGTNVDAAGTTTLFARLKQIVDTYLADATIGLAAIAAEVNADALAQGAGSVVSNVGVDSLVRAIADIVRAGGTGDLADILAQTEERVAGKTQILEVSITSAANAGNVTVATINTEACVIQSVILHADAAQTGDLTTAAVYGGAGNVITFIAPGDATQANLNAADKQVAWVPGATGTVRLGATKTITIDLQGTGNTAVDLTMTIVLAACANGGYLS